MNDFIPTTGTEAQWDAACERLNSYLRALGMDECERQNEIILQILQSAAARHATAHRPCCHPTALRARRTTPVILNRSSNRSHVGRAPTCVTRRDLESAEQSVPRGTRADPRDNARDL